MRARHLVVALLAFLVAAALWTPAAHASDEIIIKVRVQFTPVGERRQPVEGVTVTVSDDVGFSATGVTDATGVVDVPVPAAGSYTVTVDPETLPEGMDLADESAGTRVVTAKVGLGANANFNLGQASRGEGLQARSAAADAGQRRPVRPGHRDHERRVVADLRRPPGCRTSPTARWSPSARSSRGWSTTGSASSTRTGGFGGFLQMAFATLFGMAAGAAVGGTLERRRVAPDAPTRHRADVDDDRVDRRSDLHPLLRAVPLRRAGSLVQGVRHAAEHRPRADRAHASRPHRGRHLGRDPAARSPTC